MQQHLRGTFLLFAIGLMSLLVVLAYAFLRGLTRQTDASDALRRRLLAEEAALSGVHHAQEAILRGYAEPVAQVKSEANGTGSDGVRAPTFVDGPWCLPFRAFSRPGYLPLGGDDPAETNLPDAEKDIRVEHLQSMPLMPWQDGDWARMRFDWFAYQGIYMVEGRGKFFDPWYYNIAWEPTSSTVTAPLSFLDATAKPDRAEKRLGGVFLDAQYRRVDSGDILQDRKAARFRLRYAITTEDLSGHLLINPVADPEINADPASLRTFARDPGAMVKRSANALWCMLGAKGEGYSLPRWDHVFQGRGAFSNLDRRDFPPLNDQAPITWPLMYRTYPRPSGSYPAPNNTISGDKVNWHWHRLENNGGSITDNIYRSNFVNGNQAGGEVMWSTSSSVDGGNGWPHGFGRLTNMFLGPQFSWWSAHYAAAGTDLYNLPGEWPQFLFTPFGRGQVDASGGPTYPADRTWYQGRCDTAFRVNVLTAPPALISAMIVGYIPPSVKTFALDRIQWYQVTSYNPVTKSIGWTLKSTQSISETTAIRGRDLQVDSMFGEGTGHGFAEFPAPTRTGTAIHPTSSDTSIKPDYWMTDTRTAAQRYPGRLWTGDATLAGEGFDDLGKLVNADTSSGTTRCPQTGRSFLSLSVGEPTTHWYSNNNPPSEPGWWDTDLGGGTWKDGGGNNQSPNQNYFVKRFSPSFYRIKDSYWWDLTTAMATAVNVMRAQWLQKAYIYGNPSVSFPLGQLNPAKFRTLRDLDRQFLTQLGESLTHSGTADPTTLRSSGRRDEAYLGTNSGGSVKFNPMTPSHNIYSLRSGHLLKYDAVTDVDPTNAGVQIAHADNTTDAYSDERAKIMERVLNDWRMSFFGASAEYSDAYNHTTKAFDPALEFRPLDFDGDGIVRCSCYDSASPPAADADGRGPKPGNGRYWTSTGCFTTEKSHFYRIWTRGELWDNMLQRTVSEANLESVFCVDPEGKLEGDLVSGLRNSAVIFQSWHFDRYAATASALRW